MESEEEARKQAPRAHQHRQQLLEEQATSVIGGWLKECEEARKGEPARADDGAADRWKQKKTKQLVLKKRKKGLAQASQSWKTGKTGRRSTEPASTRGVRAQRPVFGTTSASSSSPRKSCYVACCCRGTRTYARGSRYRASFHRQDGERRKIFAGRRRDPGCYRQWRLPCTEWWVTHSPHDPCCCDVATTPDHARLRHRQEASSPPLPGL